MTECMIAFLIWTAEYGGVLGQTSPAIPATIGAAIDVPSKNS